MKVILAIVLLSGVCSAQTWFKVANGGDTITASNGAVLRYGSFASTYACDSAPRKAGDASAEAWASLTLAADTTITDDSIFGADPAYCVVKEIDIQETAVTQTVTVNGKAVSVPALASPVNQPGAVINVPVWAGPMVPCYTQKATASNPDGTPGKSYTIVICGPLD